MKIWEQGQLPYMPEVPQQEQMYVVVDDVGAIVDTLRPTTTFVDMPRPALMAAWIAGRYSDVEIVELIRLLELKGR